MTPSKYNRESITPWESKCMEIPDQVKPKKLSLPVIKIRSDSTHLPAGTTDCESRSSVRDFWPQQSSSAVQTITPTHLSPKRRRSARRIILRRALHFRAASLRKWSKRDLRRTRLTESIQNSLFFANVLTGSDEDFDAAGVHPSELSNFPQHDWDAL